MPSGEDTNLQMNISLALDEGMRIFSRTMTDHALNLGKM